MTKSQLDILINKLIQINGDLLKATEEKTVTDVNIKVCDSIGELSDIIGVLINHAKEIES